MARTLHKPNIVQHNGSPRKKINRQLGRRSQPHPFLCPLTPTTVTMPKDNETEGDVPGRKRISLACQRCRKRKIKCEPSNDAGDGQACLACQSAKSTDCQYLRVSSALLRCASPDSPLTSWNISTPTNEENSLNVVPAHDLSQYSISNPSQMALSTGRGLFASPTCNETFARAPGANLFVGPQRNFQPAPHQNSLDPESFSVQQAQGTLQYHQQAGSSTIYAMPDAQTSWTSPSGCGVSSIDASFAQTQPMDFDALQYQGSTYAEESPFFPGLSPLSTHLPAPTISNGKERCLPVPVQTYLAPKSQCTPETEGYNSSSGGGTESSSEASLYEYTPFGSNALVGAPMNLPNVSDPRDAQCYARLPTLDPHPTPRQEYYYPTSGVETSETADCRAQELMTPRGYRFLQPQPRRISRSLLGSNTGATTIRESKKSAAVRRQERQNVLRHQ